jgi:hypothetical protein
MYNVSSLTLAINSCAENTCVCSTPYSLVRVGSLWAIKIKRVTTFTCLKQSGKLDLSLMNFDFRYNLDFDHFLTYSIRCTGTITLNLFILHEYYQYEDGLYTKPSKLV